MASPCMWVALCLMSVMTAGSGVFTPGSLSQPPGAAALRAAALRRWRRGVTEAHRERCAELGAPWLQNTQQASGHNETLLQLRVRVRPFSPGASRGLVFPGKSLFSFIRRVYRCCQGGAHCRSVKGIQGRSRGDTDVEFVLARDILSLTVRSAELHLQLSNPEHLDIHPVLPLMATHNLPTRYSLGSQGDAVQLRVDLLFLFQSLQEMAGGAGRGPSLVNMRQVAFFSSEGPPGRKPSPGALQDPDGDGWGNGVGNMLPALDLGLVLGCSKAGSGVSCGSGGVHLSHMPFLALYYR